MLTIEEYEAKRQARYDRLITAAAKAEREGTAAMMQSSEMADTIPFGQPILVGHHSEKRDRNFRERIGNKMRKGFEIAQKAEEYRSRAASVAANDKIYSDNPQAVNLLTDKVCELESEQAEMKRINAALRKGADFDTLLMSDKHRSELIDVDRYQAYHQPRTKGFPPYMLTSINARINTAKQRAEVIEKKQATPDKDEEVNGVKIEWRASENRIRLNYGKRVSLETYNLLKQHGFKAMKENGVFSAYYNNTAGYFIKTQIKEKK